MAASASEDAGIGRSVEGISSEALAEWRSSEQVENGVPSTSPPYWDTDDDDDGGPKPSELYGKNTWKIEKFSQVNKRELRSNAFEVGGYKWYILIYPQGCDVCNHLSLFLCVANHDKLLPGWSHFAQFTIAVVNKDLKKSKYSDTLHRFWKKEHDWGWKKFMELSKVSDGFLDASDTLIIKAQVQVIREKAERPFRCLDCQYRRELVRVYLTNVEQICRRFVEERRGKLGRLIEDKEMWSSFRDFWVGMDRNTRRAMSREKTDVILKVVVKHFFIEKEVTSTLVMDSLYSGLKALESQSKSKKGRAKLLDSEEIPAPIVCVEKDTFILVDDVLHLIERAAMEPLPPKDDKGPQNRTKDGNLGEEFNKDSIERDERRLTELGRRTVEIFALAHIFNHKIEVAYQEAVALKRQEELIREEEAAWLAESDQKSKRRVVEKDKKIKKKQAKQKRNNKKGKDKGREERSVVAVLDTQEEENVSDDRNDSLVEEIQAAEEKSDILEDASDVSDSVDGAVEVLRPDLEDMDASPVSWDTYTSEAHPPTEASSTGAGVVPYRTSENRSISVVDDSSSTCSTDSVPSTIMNSPYKGSSNNQCEGSLSRGKSQRGKATCNGSWATEIEHQPSEPSVTDADQVDNAASTKANDCDSEPAALQDMTTHREQFLKKDEEVTSPQSRPITKVPIKEPPTKEKIITPSSPQSSQPSLLVTTQLKPEIKISAYGDSSHVKKASPGNSSQADKAATAVTSFQTTGITRSEAHDGSPSKIPERPAVHQGTKSEDHNGLPSKIPEQPAVHQGTRSEDHNGSPSRIPERPAVHQGTKSEDHNGSPSRIPERPAVHQGTKSEDHNRSPSRITERPAVHQGTKSEDHNGLPSKIPERPAVHQGTRSEDHNGSPSRIPERPAVHQGTKSEDHNRLPSKIPERPAVHQGTRSEDHNGSPSRIPERPAVHQGAVLSRPSSAPLVRGPRPAAPLVTMVQTAPLFARSVSAVGSLGPDPSAATQSYAPQSYRNAIIGNSIGSNSSGFSHNNPPNSGLNQSLTSAHSAGLVSAPMFLPGSADRVDPTSYGYGMVNRESLHNGPQWMDSSQRDENRSMFSDPSPVMNGFHNYNLFNIRSREKSSMQTPTSSSGRQGQFVVTDDDFPHLDIINDLLDDEHGIGMAAGAGRFYQPYGNGPQFLNRQFSMPSDSGVSGDLGSSASSSCRFERTRSYQDTSTLQRGYGQYDNLREFVPQATPLTYANGHMDGMIPSHWQMAGTDMLMMNADGETAPYYSSDYSSLSCGVNGYPYYRPSNGH